MIITLRVQDTLSENREFMKQVNTAIKRYMKKDFVELCEEKNKNGRILAAYNTCEGKIYIITEADRNMTTVLFADEY